MDIKAHMRLSLILFFILFGNNSYSQNSFSNNQCSLWGEFVVTEAYFSGISAMGKSESKLWIGKRVEFHDSVYLQIDKQSLYKNDFAYAHCIKRKSYSIKKYSSAQFSETYKILPKELGIFEQYVKYISLETCSGTPFAEIILKSYDNLIFGWDGVHFELSRLRR
jgi:hypothetical protein